MSLRRHHESSSSEVTFPKDVMIDIISKLPLKTIVCCRCVCKWWRSIISDPYFIDLHLSRSSHKEALMINEGKVFDWPGTLNKGLEIGRKVNKYHLLRDPEPEVKILLDINKQHSAPLMAAGSQLCSVNGLICYSLQDGSVCICNPILGEHMTLPRSPLGDLAPIGYGFGVSREGEYKVIRISDRKVSLINRHETTSVEIEVYTLGTDRWRSLGEIPFRLNLNWRLGGGLCNNNNVYWLPGGLGRRMYVFDLSTERFAEFPSPLSPKFYRSWGSRLGVLKGRLSCISWSSSGAEVWVLKEGEVCWREMGNIQKNTKPFVSLWVPFDIIDGLNGTRILLVYVPIVHKLMAYCLDTNTTLPLNTSLFFPNETNIKGGVDCFFYRPSFVTLDNLGSDGVIGGVKKTQETNVC